MTPSETEPATPIATSDALVKVLVQSHEVRDKVEECADDLAAKNEAIKQQISQGETTLPAHESLKEGEVVEAKVQEAAGDLNQIAETLAKGVDDLKGVEVALAGAREALALTKSSLAHALEAERLSSLRALHDPATGLPNRTLFDDRLGQAIALADRNQWTLAVMFLDLDRFKRINDVHGHATGDFVLGQVASRLLQQARDEDTLCRNGGDEFLYLVVNPQGNENVLRIASHVLNVIARPMAFNGLDLMVTPSIGIALYPEDAATGEDLIARADAAMYSAKRQALGCAFWAPQMSKA